MIKILLATTLALTGTAALAQPVATPRVASTGAVFIPKAAFDKIIAGPVAPPPSAAPAAPATPGTPGPPPPGLSTLGVVRGGDDRINVDVLKRVDAKAEGPVIHSLVTEVYYILSGGGTMMTGGTIPDAKPMQTAAGKPVNPGNIGPSMRGETIVGGTTQHVTVGDVIMIPPGVPHRFLTLDGSVTYMVVRLVPGFEKGK